ncbi:MAG: DUF1353 domain-containing protein [bacterium]|nr:DUF1353 domain-containing protein [bacterium]
MTTWINNNELKIDFESEPLIGIRYFLPSMTNEEKKSIKKYPFINKTLLNVSVTDKIKNRFYNFTIPKGYCFDGASVPRFFWRIIGSNTDNKFLVAAMVHDYMCENHECINFDRALSTKIFDSLLSFSQVGKVKRFFMKNSVDIFQKFFCKWKS